MNLTSLTTARIPSVRFCGSTIPPPIISKRNELLLHFHSDGTETRSGFELMVDVGKYVNALICILGFNNVIVFYFHNWKPTIKNWWFSILVSNNRTYEISEVGSMIYSPGFPNFYPNDGYFTWHIRFPPEQQISLHFLEFDVEYNEFSGSWWACLYMYIFVFVYDTT